MIYERTTPYRVILECDMCGEELRIPTDKVTSEFGRSRGWAVNLSKLLNDFCPVCVRNLTQKL